MGFSGMLRGLGGLAARRPDQGYDPPHNTLAPGQSGVFRGRQVVVSSSGPGTGVFVYNGAPRLGNPPVMAIVAPGVTLDPFGNTVQAVMYIGALAGSHIAWDQTGTTTLFDSLGHMRMQLVSATGRIQFFNAFGATIFLIAPDLGALFFYQDLGSATQGGTIGCESWSTSNVTDPINSTVFSPGFTSFDPIAAGFLLIQPGTITLGNAATMGFLARLAGVGQPAGSGVRPYLALAAPSAAAHPNDPHALVMVQGTSPNEANGPQVLMAPVVGNAAATPQTSAFAEVQGSVAANQADAIVSGALETWHSVAPSHAGFGGSINYKKALQTGEAFVALRMNAAASTLITSGDTIGTLPPGYRPASDNEPLVTTYSPFGGTTSLQPLNVNTAGVIAWTGPTVTTPAGGFSFIYSVPTSIPTDL